MKLRIVERLIVVEFLSPPIFCCFSNNEFLIKNKERVMIRGARRNFFRGGQATLLKGFKPNRILLRDLNQKLT